MSAIDQELPGAPKAKNCQPDARIWGKTVVLARYLLSRQKSKLRLEYKL